MKYLIEYLRRFKVSYMIFNFFYKKKLHYNEVAYKLVGINKKYYSPISSKDFEKLPNERDDLKIPKKEDLVKDSLWQMLNDENQQSLIDFSENGYAILKGYFENEKVDAINNEIDKLLESNTLNFRYRNKIMFAIHKSNLLWQLGTEKKLSALLSTILGGNAILFQSINFLKGSEQATHSDTIHMTTYPLGGLLGVWIALEDTDAQNGPLHYFKGSHKLPYLLNKDYQNEGDYFRIGNKTYNDYEQMIANEIALLGLKKEIFYAKKGDVLIWHANLLHGGEPQLDMSRTRKSMVLHYFKKGSICYHEVSQRPALFSSQKTN